MTVIDAIRHANGIELDNVLNEKAARRLNVGCGEHPMLYWTNIDADKRAIADVYATVPPLQYADGSLEEIYAGHFLEHLPPTTAAMFLKECHRALVPGGRLGIVVPDTREVMKRFLRCDCDAIEYPRGVWRRIDNLNTLNELFFYSTVQDSPHLWCYDSDNLIAALQAAGFKEFASIDRYRDERIAQGAWYQFGVDAFKTKG